MGWRWRWIWIDSGLDGEGRKECASYSINAYTRPWVKKNIDTDTDRLHPTRSSPWISLSSTHIVLILYSSPFSSCRFLFQAVFFYISFHSSLYFLNVSTAHGCYYKRSFLLFYYLSLQGHHHPLQVVLPSLPQLFHSSRRYPTSSAIRFHTHYPSAIQRCTPLSFLPSHLSPAFNFPFLSPLYKWRNLGLLWTNSKRMNVLLLFN